MPRITDSRHTMVLLEAVAFKLYDRICLEGGGLMYEILGMRKKSWDSPPAQPSARGRED